MIVTAQYVLGGVLIALALALVVLVMLQSGKDTRMSGTISGGSDTYYGQNKGHSRDKLLSRLTVVVGSLFIGTMMAAYILFSWWGKY